MPEALVPDDYLPLVRAALAEDIGRGDATTLALVPEDSCSTVVMVAREPMVMAGVDLVLASFQEVDERIEAFLARHAGSGAAREPPPRVYPDGVPLEMPF